MSTSKVSHRVNRSLGLLIVTGLIALAVVFWATAALAGIHLPGQQPSEGVTVERVVAVPSFHQATTGTVTVHAAPKPPPPPAAASHGSVWDRLAQCESGGRWNYNGGSGYDGGLQFSPSTWRAAGGTKYAPYAHQASREEQIAVAKSWLARTSWRQWPACSRKLGLR